jgi:hypothetical protein
MGTIDPMRLASVRLAVGLQDPAAQPKGATWKGQFVNWTDKRADDFEIIFRICDWLVFATDESGAILIKPDSFRIGGNNIPTATVLGKTAARSDDVTVGKFKEPEDGKVRGFFCRYRTYRAKFDDPIAPGAVIDVEYVLPPDWFLSGIAWTVGGQTIDSTPRESEKDIGWNPSFHGEHLFMGHILPVPVGDDGKPSSNDWHIEGKGLVGAAVSGKQGKVKFTPETQDSPAKIDVTDVNYGDLRLGDDGRSNYSDIQDAIGAGATTLTIIRRRMETLVYWHTLDGQQVGEKQEFG